jgi:tetratricopeptide (TPR) repeat protein
MQMNRLAYLVAGALVAALTPLPAQGHIDLSVPLAELQRRVSADSNDPAAHYNVALGYWNAKQWDRSNQELRAALKLEPRFAAAHLALAYLPMVQNFRTLQGVSHIGSDSPKELREALAQHNTEFQRAFMIDPMVDMRIIAAGTDALNLNDPAADVVLGPTLKAYFQGFSDCEEGRYGDCESNLGLVIREYGNSKKSQRGIPTNVLWYHGLAAAHQKEFAVAIADFNALIDRDSAAVAKAEEKDVVRIPIRSPQYRYFIADFQQASGDDVQAVASYQAALEKDLSLFMAHVRLADIYQRRKDFAHAIAERKDAVNTNPDDASLQVDLGVTLGLAGKFDEARDALKTATDALPRNADAWYWLGVADEQLGQKADARRAYDHVVALAPSRLQARVDQAKAHLARLGS